MSNYDSNQFGHLKVDEICHLSEKQQAEVIAESFSSISQQYQPIKTNEINMPHFSSNSVPVFRPTDIRMKLNKVMFGSDELPQ